MVALVLAQAGATSVLWQGDFSSSDFSQYWSSPQCRDGSRATIIPSPDRPGRLAARLLVLPGDTNITGSGPRGERCDLMIDSAATDAYEGHENWYAWSTYFPSDYNPVPSTGWNLFFDFHNSGGGGQSNQNFEVDTHFDPPVLKLRVYGGPPDGGREGFLLAPFERNRWYEFVEHVRWSSDPNAGFVEIWLNGRLVVPFHHRATLYEGQSAYLKLANYRAASSQPSALVHGGALRGQSYADVTASFPVGVWPQDQPASYVPFFSISSSIGSRRPLSDLLLWTASVHGVSNGSIKGVDYYIDGVLRWSERFAPYVFNGDAKTLDTRGLRNGKHSFKVVATAIDDSTASAVTTATVSNKRARPRPK